MKRSLLFIIGFSLLVGCSESKKEVEVKETVEVTENTNSVIPNEVLIAEISGMSCEMACGGSIRKGLLETGSVARVQFENFDMESEINTAKIYFDKDKISAEKITAIIAELNNKQFTVHKTETQEYQNTTSSINESTTSSGSSSNSGTCCAEVKSTSLQLPNLFDLLRSVVLN